MTAAPFAPLDLPAAALPSLDDLERFSFPALTHLPVDLSRYSEVGVEHIVYATDETWRHGLSRDIRLWELTIRHGDGELPANIREVMDSFNENPHASWLALFAHHAALRVAETKAAYEAAKALNSAIWFHPDRKRDVAAEQSFTDLIGVTRAGV